jgi:hypothetical protein
LDSLNDESCDQNSESEKRSEFYVFGIQASQNSSTEPVDIQIRNNFSTTMFLIFGLINNVRH